jgi:hypothetical protein
MRNLNQKHFLLIFSLLIITSSCQDSNNNKILDSSYLHNANVALEQDIVHDFFSPPVASRIYLYPNLLAYEIMSSKDSNYASLNSVFPNFPNFPKFKSDQGQEIAALYGFLKVARELVYTTNHIDKEINKLDSLLESHSKIEYAKKYSDEISIIMIAWLKKDNYNETRNMGEYQLLNQEDSWIPTGPDYMDALEPHWSKIRPMTLDSASQFAPPPPTKYDMTIGSQYYNELMEVYNVVNAKTASTEAIAKFWDCNPIISRHEGHITYSEKKLTPGGHWMNIFRTAALKENLELMEVSYAYTSLCIGMFDAFISCWEAKYTTNYIRPITVIQNQIDASWNPILYTPNFPEYPSGHSVVSRSASTVLTHIFGDNYAFIDSTEAPYGMPPRSFTSFYDASDEAAVSRLYGGIHYKPAIYDGIEQGNKVGKHVVSKIKTLKK